MRSLSVVQGNQWHRPLTKCTHGCEGGPAVEESFSRDSVGSAPRVSCEDSSGIRPSVHEESEGTRVSTFTGDSSVPEDENPGDMDPECPVLFPDDEEWKSLSRVQSQSPEGSRSGGQGHFHSGDEVEDESPTDREVFPLTIEHGENRSDSPLHAVSWVDESHPGWRMIQTVMDSGATDSVAPPTIAPHVSIAESPGSIRGQCYVSASAGRMPNMGQMVLNVQTNEGKYTTVVYQVAEVSRPLTSVGATCDRGNWVVYNSQGGFILNCQTGERTSFDRTASGIYELDLWMRNENGPGNPPSSSFPRQGY